MAQKFKAEIDIMPQAALLDPQGKAVSSNMSKIGLAAIENVRIGKHITLEVEAESEDKAKEMVEEACNKLLVNAIMEDYSFELTAI